MKSFLPTGWVAVCALACANGTSRQEPLARHKLAEVDDFGVLLIEAGLSTDDLPMGRSLSAETLHWLRLQLDLNRPKPSEEAPWMVANLVLREVAQPARKSVPRAELNQRIQAFESLYLLRRDGYFARALSGKAEQCVGPVEIRDGGLRAGPFEVDQFYSRDARQQWHPVAGSLAVAPSK